MSYIKRPKITHPGLPKNKIGLTIRDYEGAMSTLCAGCGHDSISAAIMQAYFELALEPHRVAKVSGIGCSSKTPTYFLGGAHGFNSVHGRMPSIATGANAGNRELQYIGVSGDGDSLSIGLGQFAHAIRRNIDMMYLIENNGVYGLTKGQFSASADRGSKAKKGEANPYAPIDPVLLAISLGCTFVGRGFSGDKEHLVPLIKSAIKHKGFALLDIISPCVTFNDHEGSTKSYAHTRENMRETVYADFTDIHEEIVTQVDPGEYKKITMHDGSRVGFKRVDTDFDPTDRIAAISYIEEHRAKGEVVTGLLYLEPGTTEMHSVLGSSEQAMATLPYEKLNPGKSALERIQSRWR
ncbi:MAG: 2-oxoacid:ferredoxin oxidoreductase subunit beta [Gammaproteobacteria bacterium]|nr:2-oxoacid:ferredoxin oxidoreductase subunit beta [Gammaproteobacteria bacterium]